MSDIQQLDGLTFDESTHTYTDTATGEVVPSVTQLIGAILRQYDDVPQQILTTAATHGTRVHAAIEHFCKTGQAPDDISPISFVNLALQSYVDWTWAYGIKPIFCEERVLYYDDDGSPLFAGTLDQVVVIKGHIVLGDIKTTDQLHTDALKYQLSAYKIALEQRYPALRIEAGCCFYLPKKKAPEIVRVDLMEKDEIVQAMRQARRQLIADTQNQEKNIDIGEII